MGTHPELPEFGRQSRRPDVYNVDVEEGGVTSNELTEDGEKFLEMVRLTDESSTEGNQGDCGEIGVGRTMVSPDHAVSTNNNPETEFLFGESSLATANLQPLGEVTLTITLP